ncbi:hypothetical protein L3X38_026555 [Prunus dulcis]|uniref:Uncharacterized protein n=1 Tax=Prunus dulcis TaxID=3755 RepID=A0AAD4YZK4_PRUDU|nr:hypothetical protein L3X38_026555 [Prunus dulcis]
MTLPRPLLSKPIRTVPPPPLPSSFNKTAKLSPNLDRVSGFSPHAFKFIVSMAASSRHGVSSDPQHSSSQLIPSNVASDSSSFQNSPSKVEDIEGHLDKVIYRFRFMAFLGVLGSLIGSFLCFIKGCTYVVRSFMEYSVNRNKVIWSLVEAIDVYLLGTVMLVFGMGLYELFISNLDIVKSSQENKPTDRSNLLGMFTLKERPKWLDITTVNELKTKLGHVIVMLLLIGLFEKTYICQSMLTSLCTPPNNGDTSIDYCVYPNQNHDPFTSRANMGMEMGAGKDSSLRNRGKLIEAKPENRTLHFMPKKFKEQIKTSYGNGCV